ncbi:MAG: efflux RND transporter periplasmic adaptor subunit [Methylophilaceae bacterium]
MSKYSFTTYPAINSLLLAALLAGCSASSAPPSNPHATEVGVLTIKSSPQVMVTDLPGRTNAYMISEIRPQVGGIVRKRNFVEGAHVNAGDLLYQIEPAPYQATYASAEAAVQKAEANIVSIRAKAQRYTELVKINAVSQQDDDDIQASLKQAEADRASSKAALDTARINLDFTKIVSPISGIVATSTVTPGALVTANQETSLTNVQQLDPIYVDVTQSSNDLLKLKKQFAAGKLKRTGHDEVRIRVVLEDGSEYGHEGRLKFSGVSVNPSSGAVTLRAVVPNPDGLLMPGMYVHALLDQAIDEHAMLVPQRSLTRNSRGQPTVLVVGADDKVELKILTVGDTIGDSWLVTSGLSEGDQVIIDGLQKVKVGDVVKPVFPQADASAGDTNQTAGASAKSVENR